jgi:hypothetical protein
MYDLTELKRCLISQQDNNRHDMTICPQRTNKTTCNYCRLHKISRSNHKQKDSSRYKRRWHSRVYTTFRWWRNSEIHELIQQGNAQHSLTHTCTQLGVIFAPRSFRMGFSWALSFSCFLCDGFQTGDRANEWGGWRVCEKRGEWGDTRRPSFLYILFYRWPSARATHTYTHRHNFTCLWLTLDWTTANRSLTTAV